MNTSIDQAIHRIPPLWPLKHFVAVNPFIGLKHLTFAEAASLLQQNAGAHLHQSPRQYLEAFRKGEIRRTDVKSIAGDTPVVDMISDLEEACEAQAGASIQSVAAWLDSQSTDSHWSAFIIDEISKWCGVFFDENQATWTSPWKGKSLFAAWREAALHDRNPAAFGIDHFNQFIKNLPNNAEETIASCLKKILPPQIQAEDFLHHLLMQISGWAGYAQYLAREDQMRGNKNSSLIDLLAIRLAYDTSLFESKVSTTKDLNTWKNLPKPAPDTDQIRLLSKWQQAYEFGYQANLAALLAAARKPELNARADSQTIFCIDVRSEIFRRHLEQARPGTQTIGFAGFFGFPIAHCQAGTFHHASRCPVLLVPPVQTEEPLPEDLAARASRKRAEKGAWKAFQYSATSSFSFVETIGLAFAGVLGRLTPFKTSGGPLAKSGLPPVPGYTSIDLSGQIALAHGALKNMSLTKGFARLILICGHGSHAANNPHASSLDCGACGGHPGDVNARIASTTLNKLEVRKGLVQLGIRIPSDTHFIAGLHNTLNDSVHIYRDQEVPETHTAELAVLETSLMQASRGTRAERAQKLDLENLSDENLERRIRARAFDISQVRPEWALANNAALVAAPRYRTAGLKLDGRVFLHDYLADDDPSLEVLTLILTAPVVVASWINLQYYASRIDPKLYGSGDKALHNVIGGIGVTEGNGGDLKSGLPLQSIHDGQDFVHEPRRLAVYIEASPENIDKVLNANIGVRDLFDHEWITITSLQDSSATRRVGGKWLSY